VSKRVHKLSCSIVIAIVFETLFFIAPCGAQQLGNDMLSVSVDTKDGTYRLAVPGGQPIFTSRVAAQVNHEWLVPPTIHITRRWNLSLRMISARAGLSRSQTPDFPGKRTSFL
jgi:hypothetical protein